MKIRTWPCFHGHQSFCNYKYMDLSCIKPDLYWYERENTLFILKCYSSDWLQLCKWNVCLPKAADRLAWKIMVTALVKAQQLESRPVTTPKAQWGVRRTRYLFFYKIWQPFLKSARSLCFSENLFSFFSSAFISSLLSSFLLDAATNTQDYILKLQHWTASHLFFLSFHPVLVHWKQDQLLESCLWEIQIWHQ